MTNTTSNCKVCGTTDDCRCCYDCGGSFKHGGGTYGCVCWSDGDHADDCNCHGCIDSYF